MKEDENTDKNAYHHPVSQKDIARKAGLSQSSVARALANNPNISEATRERVKQIAKSLGYRPRPYIAAWMRQVKAAKPQTRVGNFVWLDFPLKMGSSGKDFFSEQVKSGAVERAENYGFGLHHVFLEGNSKKEVDYAFKRFIAQGISGILLTAKAEKHFHLLQEQADSFTWVSVGDMLGEAGPHFVCNDQFLSAQLAVIRLKKMGFRRIALVINEGLEWRAHRRFSFGFLSGIQPWFQKGSNDLEKSNIFCASAKHIPLFEDYLRRLQPEVVLSITATEYQWMRDFGIKIPDDMSFACLDIAHSESQLSGIDQQYRKLGETAIDVLMSQLNRNQRGFVESPEATMIRGVWVPGKTLKLNPTLP